MGQETGGREGGKTRGREEKRGAWRGPGQVRPEISRDPEEPRRAGGQGRRGAQVPAEAAKKGQGRPRAGGGQARPEPDGRKNGRSNGPHSP